MVLNQFGRDSVGLEESSRIALLELSRGGDTATALEMLRRVPPENRKRKAEEYLSDSDDGGSKSGVTKRIKNHEMLMKCSQSQ